MSQNSQDQPEEQEILILGPQGQDDDTDGDDERHVTELVEQPAKVMRIGTMIRQLLEEVKSAPLDEASRNRLKEIHQSSIKELEAGLAPELVEELERISLPFTEGTPSRSEEHTSELQSLMRISYAVFCLNKKRKT